MKLENINKIATYICAKMKYFFNYSLFYILITFFFSAKLSGQQLKYGFEESTSNSYSKFHQTLLSEQSQISVLICGPGEELYSKFGHAAIRIIDNKKNIDRVFNYGTFDPSMPNFYTKFLKGQMLYELSVTNTVQFLYTYQMEKRWVTELILNLEQEEKQRLFNFLEINALPENKYYLYDFVHDNCATAIIDVLQNELSETIEHRYNEEHYSKSFRNLIHEYLQDNSWNRVGIDLVLGSVMDRTEKYTAYAFLPDYTAEQIKQMKVRQEKLVQSERDLLRFDYKEISTPFLLTPGFWIALFSLIILLLNYIDFKNGMRNWILDQILFSILGALGIFLCFMWFGTDHKSTKFNFNVFWINPLFLILGLVLGKNKFIKYWHHIVLFAILILMLSHSIMWIIGYQQLSALFIPLIVIIYLRLILLLYHYYFVELYD